MINPEEGQEPPLDQRPNIIREDLVPIKSTVTQTTVGLHQWNWIRPNTVKERTLEESKATNQKRAIHVANQATSQEIVVQRTWWFHDRSMLC
jgi:hypothetical protein